MKKVLSLLVALFMLIPCTVNITALGKSYNDFYDVRQDNPYYDAIMYLAEKGVINGYTDNTFKPNNQISRAEASTIIVRASGLDLDNYSGSIYNDVANDFWARPYIMTATNAGIVSGVGNNNYSPNNYVTYNQIIKMVVCMMSWDDKVQMYGGWPDGYLYIAKEKGIIDDSTYWNLYTGMGNFYATRGDVAQYIYNASSKNDGPGIEVAGKKYFIGMSTSELGTPDETLYSYDGSTWYVYGTKTYKDFVMLRVQNNSVVSIASVGVGFSYNGFRAGDTINSQATVDLKTDSNDNNKIHAVYIGSNSFASATVNDNTTYGESRMNFHCTNAFRVLHGMSILKWSDAAATSAQLHTEDMARNNYFSHDSQDGRKSSERLRAQGINWRAYGENISAGYSSGFDAYNGWVNSSGHRNNMLSPNFTYLGVGSTYYFSSRYGFYYTQNFYS